MEELKRLQKNNERTHCQVLNYQLLLALSPLIVCFWLQFSQKREKEKRNRGGLFTAISLDCSSGQAFVVSVLQHETTQPNFAEPRREL